MKPLNKVKIKWSPEFAYAIGLLATDGNLSKDGRHLSFVSKDLVLVKTFCECLGLKNKIGSKTGGFVNSGLSHQVQFGDVNLYKYLVTIGFSPAKSKTLKNINIPNKYFFDFLRGSFDGDGTIYSYFDKRWKNSFMFYINFASASLGHVTWLQEKIFELLKFKGSLKTNMYANTYKLVFAKKESALLISKMYYSSAVPRLERKYKKAYNILVKDKKVKR